MKPMTASGTFLDGRKKLNLTPTNRYMSSSDQKKEITGADSLSLNQSNQESTESLKSVKSFYRSLPVKLGHHATKFEDNSMYYNQKSNQTGLMLILNSRENRAGTDEDVANLKSFFGGTLHYTVYDPRSQEETDLTAKQIDYQLKKVKRELNASGHLYHCFICVILSHGDESGIKTKYGVKNAEDIRQEFNNKETTGFVGRPKVFLIQACRGKRNQDFVVADGPAKKTQGFDESDVSVRVPTDADTLMFFSTTPGYVSYRNKESGTCFISECLSVFKKNHHKAHLEEMLITVRNIIALTKEFQVERHGPIGKQMPCVWSTLTRRLML